MLRGGRSVGLLIVGLLARRTDFFSVLGSLILSCKPAGIGVRTEPGKKGHLKVIISNKTKASVSSCFISSLKKTRRTEGQAPHTKVMSRRRSDKNTSRICGTFGSFSALARAQTRRKMFQ